MSTYEHIQVSSAHMSASMCGFLPRAHGWHLRQVEEGALRVGPVHWRNWQGAGARRQEVGGRRWEAGAGGRGQGMGGLCVRGEGHLLATGHYRAAEARDATHRLFLDLPSALS